MFDFSCKDCPDRVVGCHATCERYLKERADYEKMKQKEEPYKSLDNHVCSQILNKRNYMLRKYGRSTF